MNTERASPATVDSGQSTAPVGDLRVSAFQVPTEEPESDGTLEWDSTTLVLVEVDAGGETGIGYSYMHAAAAPLIDEQLAEVVRGIDSAAIGAAWHRMHHAIRNFGSPGLSAGAISAVDVALWDLKARLLDVSVADLVPAAHAEVPIYGSGGFTSYSIARLQEQLSGWADEGISMVKMKVGREPSKDVERVRAARDALGDAVALFVDANGAYSRKQALWFAEAFADFDVSWFEEPVSSDDLEGLRLLRDRAPAGMDITAGEYGYDSFYFRRMLDAGAVDVLQVDATRCAGITGVLGAGALCQAHSVDISAHTAPSIHAHACCGLIRCRHVEYFHDHARLEDMLFDGALKPVDGTLRPDRSRPGLGLNFRWADAGRYQIYGRR